MFSLFILFFFSYKLLNIEKKIKFYFLYLIILKLKWNKM
jgi:hypothetical protein